MVQMVEENKSLWRIKNKYLTDSSENPEHQTFFEKLAQQKEATISELSTLIQSEMNKQNPTNPQF
jgi:hypothetical protein